MEEILAQAKRAAEDAELFEVRSEETSVQFETNRLKRIQTRQSRTLALRVIKNGRIGFALTAGSADANFVNSAVETAEFGMAARFAFPPLLNYLPVEVYDRSVEAFPVAGMIRLGDELIGKIRSHTPELICDGGVSRALSVVTILNSRGGRASYTRSLFSLGVEGNLIRGTDMLFVGDGDSSCHPLEDSKPIAARVIEQLERAKELAAAPTRVMPVVFTPHGVASVLMPSLMTGFNGKLVLEGASPVGDKLGQQVFDKKLTIRDEPTVAFRPQSRPCDDEGTPSQSTPLIQEGVVTNFLYDLQTAALAGRRSTGSASRARSGLPAPSPSAFVIAPGDTTFEEMIRDIKEGLVIEQVLGAEQGNILGGDFSGNVLLGYKIDSGRLVGRVKNTMITGNVYRILSDIAAIGSESRWVNGSLNTPPVYCPAVSVASQ